MENRFFLHRLWIWCKRFRHRCGYGVHSPADFFLITSVIYETHPYYAYRLLEQRRFTRFLPHYRKKVNRLLFRLVNHLQPSTLLEVGIGNGASIGYMRAACRSMESFTIKGRDREKTLQQLDDRLKQVGTLDCLHIAYTPYYKEVFERALSHVGPHSCFIVGGIHREKARNEWWKQVVTNEEVGITFDLYDIGLVFFDKARYKQHYIVNFL